MDIGREWSLQSIDQMIEGWQRVVDSQVSTALKAVAPSRVAFWQDARARRLTLDQPSPLTLVKQLDDHDTQA